MKLIGAGFGRTGTLSLKKALELIGFGPCYHMDEMIRYPQHMDVWKAVAQGKPVNWDDIFENYQSSLDFPASLYYRELLAAYPDAKVVLTVREPERWYQSMYETAYTMMELYTPAWVKKYVPQYKRFADLIDVMIWNGLFNGKFADKEHAIQIFNAHIEEVKKNIPAEKLLIFNVKEGWKPLCDFLGIPVPEDIPFPHINDHETVKKQIERARTMYQVIPYVGIGIILLIVWLMAKLIIT
ncbi:MAG: sulfotransferase family protein [Anaerolineales bacterium]|nr:sulfotransferase family protein [Anaerolineales bacterium]